jgi:RNA polymerase sigma factor (sigma-70 family)
MIFLAATLHLYLSAAAVLAPVLSVASDESLMQAYSAGDARAFEILYTRHRAPFWRYLTRLIGSSAEGEELFQDAWQRVIVARDSYRTETAPSGAASGASGAPFRAWLFRIGHNLAMDRLRHKNIAPESSMDDNVLQFPASSEAEPEKQSISAESHALLMQSLAALPTEQRDVVLLRAEGDLSLEEIGALTGEGRETVKSRLRYALAKLKQSLA